MEHCKASVTVPADPAFARSVRMMASSLAILCGMSMDDIDDVRMVAEEGFVLSCATGAESCDIAFSLEDGAMGIDFTLGPDEADDEDTQYARLLLEAVCDEYEADAASGTLHALKRAVV